MKAPILPKLLCALGLSLLSAMAAAKYLEVEPFVRFCVYPASSDSRDTIAAPGDCGEGGELRKLPALQNKAFNTTHDEVTRAIVFVHGAGQDPSHGYEGVRDGFVGNDENTTWVVAPQFLGFANNKPRDKREGYLHWANDDLGGYSLGEATVYPAGVHVSSFDVVDNLIERMVRLARNLTTVVVIGHSAGGRFMSRYSMRTTIDDGSIAPGRSIAFRYIIASLGAYPYLSGARYRTSDQVPPRYVTRDPNNSNCVNTYDDYPYGLSNLPATPHYMSGASREQLIDRIKAKSRLYIVGSADSDPLDPEQSCEAKLQGTKGRVDRALNHWHHLGTPEVNARANALFCVVPGLDHGGRPLLASAPAAQYWHDGTIDSGCVPPSQWPGPGPASR